ncbi:DUF6659 family protein [Nitrosopumilus maritimus]|uniref:Roadblock/LAMTOR2 domain-containing protein n=1 Tax=Nitrosopumilus maritimus (strain SCM1) TaxID=436308 RepID=A9A2K7_NITMS|nr:DUF6659 family protein [Nitrosopumilus maritimus]ABX13246.1 hypothetical protein Nmar_1350 [Nitrosopumilus maritimus SCM1]
MDYERICKDILHFDSKIRFCGVTNAKSELIASISKNPEEKFLSKDEMMMSIHYTLDRSEKHTNLSYKIGNEKSAVIEYDKVTMITIPLEKKELLLISTEPEADYYKIIAKARESLS